MATIYYENDIDRGALDGKTIAVVGYGSQGQAQARNLRDSGMNVLVAERPGSANARLAEEHGFTVHSAAEAAARADLVALLVPDHEQAKAYAQDILPNLTENKALLFAHGFALHYGQIVPPDNVDVVLLAPKAPGPIVRSEFEAGAGVPCLVAVCRDFSGRALKIALAYGLAIGGARAGIIESTVREETESALFGAQAVFAGGVPELVRAAFDALVDNGCQPEVACVETLRQAQFALDLVRKGGMGLLHASLSDTAAYGGLTRGPRVVGESARDAMHEIMSEIRNGSFAREWLCENLVNAPVLHCMRERADAHPIEAAGKTLRKNAL